MQRLLMGTAVGVTATILSIAPVRDAKSIAGEFSANLSLVSEYNFRGVSQTDDAPAARGGFDWSATVNLAGFDVNLTWSDTDMSETECGDACGILLLSVSRSF